MFGSRFCKLVVEFCFLLSMNYIFDGIFGYFLFIYVNININGN
jgi:hypothetical protein